MDTTPTRRSSVRLHREWRHLRRRPDAVERARTWGLGPIADLDDVLALAGLERAPTAAHDRTVRHLVELARTDDLAARVVVQRLLPGLLTVVARRNRRGHRTGNDPLDELLGAAWVAVRTFDPARRPSSLAAALVSDAEYRVFRAPYRRRRPDPVDPTTLDLGTDGESSPHPLDELHELLADAEAAGMPRSDLDLAQRLVTSTSTEAVAAALGVTARTIRNRRKRLTDHLRAVALQAA